MILEGLLSMVTELKEKQEAQVTPASREETLERLNAIEQALSELHSNPAVPEKDLQAIRSQLDEIRMRRWRRQSRQSARRGRCRALHAETHRSPPFRPRR